MKIPTHDHAVCFNILLIPMHTFVHLHLNFRVTEYMQLMVYFVLKCDSTLFSLVRSL